MHSATGERRYGLRQYVFVGCVSRTVFICSTPLLLEARYAVHAVLRSSLILSGRRFSSEIAWNADTEVDEMHGSAQLHRHVIRRRIMNLQGLDPLAQFRV
jgi:hypothetical protein